MVMTKEEYEEKQKNLLEEKKWINETVEKGGCCCICGYTDNPLVIEQHHLAGKHNGDITLPLCPTCHRVVSMKQDGWEKEWINSDNVSRKKLAFKLRGWADIHTLIATEMRNESEKILREEHEK